MMSPQGRRSLADRKYDQGLKKLIAREYEDALRYFLWAIKECPDVEDFYVKRSECYLVIGDFVRALSDAHEALKLNPESGDIKARIADCMAYLENDVRDLMQKKRFDDCLEIIEKVHKISPGNVILNVLCIKILMEKDKIESAQIINKINLVMEIASRKNNLSAFPPHEKLNLIDNEYPQISIENVLPQIKAELEVLIQSAEAQEDTSNKNLNIEPGEEHFSLDQQVKDSRIKIAIKNHLNKQHKCSFL